MIRRCASGMAKTQGRHPQILIDRFRSEPTSTSSAKYSARVRPPLLKRPLDLTLSALGLLMSAPLWALIGLAIKWCDGGPVFYPQERVGIGGKTFKSLKFRTMVADAD